MSIFSYKINSVSSKISKIEDKYYLESKYYLDNESLKCVPIFKKRLIDNGYIYGELNKSDVDDYSISLSKVSHMIVKIDMNLTIERKMKLKKLKGEKIINPFNVVIKIKILDTYNGNMIKLFMNNNGKIKSYLNCIKDDNSNSIKILTENIEA